MAPSSSTSPLKKLLITDPKPKSKPKSESAAASVVTPAESPDRNTLDQPNLSDCHSCGYRINHTNPKDRLQLLNSIWRIVLLCRDCRKAIRFGGKCPYCFHETGSSGNLYQCGVCERKIHKDCVGFYGNSSPWCYLRPQLEGINVCVDCWVPELLKNSFRASMRSENDDGGKHLLEKKRKKAKGKANQAENAQEHASKRIKLSRNGVDLSKVVLALPAVNYKNSARIKNSRIDQDSGGRENLNGAADVTTRDFNTKADGTTAKKSDNGANGTTFGKSNSCADGGRAENVLTAAEGLVAKNLDSASRAVGDDALAIELHRVLNKSLRISRTNSLMNSNSIDVSKIRDWSGLTYKRHGLGRIRSGGQQLYIDSERVVQPGEGIPCSDVNGLKSGLLPYKRDKRRKIWQIIGEDTVVSKSIPDRLAAMNIGSQFDDSSTQSPLKSNTGLSEALLCNTSDRSNGTKKVNRFGRAFIGYNRTRFKRKVCQMNGQASVSGECRSCGNIALGSKSNDCQSDRAGFRTSFLAKIDAEGMPSGSYGAKVDCSRAKIDKCNGTFKRKKLFHATGLDNFGAEGSRECEEELYLPNQIHNRPPCFYLFKYAKRMKGSKSGSMSDTRLQAVTFLNQIEASATELTTNCSDESRVVSDVSIDSITSNGPK